MRRTLSHSSHLQAVLSTSAPASLQHSMQQFSQVERFRDFENFPRQVTDFNMHIAQYPCSTVQTAQAKLTVSPLLQWRVMAAVSGAVTSRSDTRAGDTTANWRVGVEIVLAQVLGALTHLNRAN